MGVFRRKRKDGSAAPTLSVDFKYRGQRIAEDTGLSDERSVAQWIADKKAEIDRAASQPSTNWPRSLSQALQRYWLEKRQFSKGAERNDKYLFKTIALTLGPDLPMTELTTATVATYAAKRRSGGIAASTINNEISTIRAMHRYAIEVWEMELRPIAWRRLKLKEPKRVRTVPTGEQIKHLAAVAHPELRPVIMFAALTGLRRHEIAKLKWSEINLEAGTMKLIGKGDKEAELPLSSAVISLLLSRPQGNSSALVFDTSSFQRRWNAARRKAGAPSSLTFHSLRHSFAALFKAETDDVMKLKTAMRHSSLDMSFHYAQTVQSDGLLSALEAVGEKLLGSRGKSNGSLPHESEPPSDPSSAQPEEEC